MTDIGLPDGSGWDLIAVRSRTLAVAANRRRDGMGATRRRGAEGDFILRKPVRTSELLAQVAGAKADQRAHVRRAGDQAGARVQIAATDLDR